MLRYIKMRVVAIHYSYSSTYGLLLLVRSIRSIALVRTIGPIWIVLWWRWWRIASIIAICAISVWLWSGLWSGSWISLARFDVDRNCNGESRKEKSQQKTHGALGIEVLD